MNKKILSVLLLLCTLLPAGYALADEAPKWGDVGEMKVVEDKQNVVASELLGEWVLDEEISKRLGTDREQIQKITFEAQPEAEKSLREFMMKTLETLKKLPDEAHKITPIAEAMRAVYQVGEMKLGIKGKADPVTFQFMLVSFRGNPHVIFMADGDAESFNVMMVQDPEGDKDLLFVGGDHAGEPFIAFKRAGK